MKKRILIVEDNELNRAMLCEILSGEYQVLEADNGQTALDVLHRYADSISLILLDVMMPVMDGYTFLDRIKDDSELSLIPVIVMTQSDSESDEVAALEHGATDFVPKPYRPQVILHRVASIINLRETAAMINQFQYDRLTGLYNKDFFYQKVRERLSEDPEQDYCIVCSNIENFKLINDVFGTPAGDRLLKDVAAATQKIVGNTGFCARFSADRFLCFQKKEQEQQDRKNFEKFGDEELSPLLKNVTMRWGIYQITDRSIPVEQMCDRAMLAVNSIKGRYNRFFAVYDDSLRKNLLREQVITDAMNTALTEGQFQVFYQPKYSLNDNRMVGAEALVRWIHPEWGFMSPGEFIPLFEKNGFISRLDRHIWELVCAQLREWQDKGHPVLPVSVNMSRADVFMGDLEDTLLHLVEKYRINPANLHLEITESAYVENLDKIANTVEKLRRRGFIVEMDDFGSGYSSLSMLSQMKLDILKLDMKFVWNETAKPADQSILYDIIGAAHRMHMSVVAEGVENKDQVQRLMSSGCDYVQGYYFAKPMPAAEFEELLKVQTARQFACAPEQAQDTTDIHKLLLVDESSAYKEQVRRLFEGQYQILDASNAQDAIEYLKNYGDGNISAVILSATLPSNGAEAFLNVMRSDPTFWNIPVLSTIPNSDVAHELPSVITTGDFLCKCHPLFDLRRRVENLIEISAFHKREKILKDEACRDYLTGLLNRRGLQAAFASLRKNDMPLAVVLFDVDNLKNLNDSFGHNTGDSIIRSFADLLRRQTRADDIQCRYGGDEFLVILKNLPDEMTALKKAEDICRIFRNDFATDEFSTGCSGGIAWCGLDENLSSALIERADQALYRAKHKEKGSCCIWKK